MFYHVCFHDDSDDHHALLVSAVVAVPAGSIVFMSPTLWLCVLAQLILPLPEPSFWTALTHSASKDAGLQMQLSRGPSEVS